jgi:DNA invertase Pin-like site-specific DNA recombinase
MKVLILVREDQEAGGSGVSEMERCLSYAEAQQWVQAGVHELDGQDGGTWEPLGRQLAETGAAALLTADLSRVTDNMQEFILFLRMIKQHHAKLYTVKDGEVVDFSAV